MISSVVAPAGAAEVASLPLGEIEELTLCSCCKRQFDEAERPRKLLACKHTFCLSCARGVLARGGGGVRCLHCWGRTPPPPPPTHAPPTHAPPTHAPQMALARRLAAPGLLARERGHMLQELDRLAARRRDFLMCALDATTALKLRLEAELAADAEAAGSLAAAADERSRLRTRLAAAALQARVDAAVAGAATPLDARELRRARGRPAPPPSAPPPSAPPPPSARRDPLVFLANYCAAQLCARPDADDDTNASGSPTSPGPMSPPASGFPLFYFDLEVNGASVGRVVIEVRADVAPRMARNFAALATGAAGVGYRGCSVFQCWEGESVITGDFELNNGRGGRSAFEESSFLPDDTRLVARRGAVGMRRSQRRRDTLGLVGSQFRIVLREMRGFTAIFASVVAGLPLVDRLSRAGDGAGKPHSSILISDCGQLN